MVYQFWYYDRHCEKAWYVFITLSRWFEALELTQNATVKYWANKMDIYYISEQFPLSNCLYVNRIDYIVHCDVKHRIVKMVIVWLC